MEMISCVPVDLVLSDVVLPTGSGFDVALHAQRVRPHTPVILMSAFAASDLVMATAMPNLRDFLRKPFAPRELIAAVQQVSAISRNPAKPEDGAGTRSRRYAVTGTLRGLLRLIGMRDAYTLVHARRVRRLVADLARAMAMPDQFRREATLAGWVLDVGRINIPLAVLNKPGPLTLAEEKLVRTHPAVGAAILDSLGMPEPVVGAVRYHHERYDGRTLPPFPGYPYGLSGEQIPLMARVVALADAYDAMITPRAYRTIINPAGALAEVERMAGQQFDPAIAGVFVRMMRNRRDGSHSPLYDINPAT
jgi:putative two-component system response regulator